MILHRIAGEGGRDSVRASEAERRSLFEVIPAVVITGATSAARPGRTWLQI